MGRFYGFLFPSVDPSGLTPRPKIYPFQQGLGAAAHPDGARLEVRGSRLRALFSAAV